MRLGIKLEDVATHVAKTHVFYDVLIFLEGLTLL